MSTIRDILAKIVDAAGNVVSLVETETGFSLPIYQTNKNKAGYVHFHINDLAVGTYKFVLIDISDVSNYNHDADGYAHIESIDMAVISDSVNTEWELTLGFLDEVDGTGSKIYPFDHNSGAKDTGNNMIFQKKEFPVGPHLHKDFITVYPPSITSDFQSDVLEKSALSPFVADVNPANGDVVSIVEILGGPIRELKINIAYHSHSNPV